METTGIRGPAAPLVAVLLFVAVTGVRFLSESVGDGYALLYVLPIALMALRYGLAGGLGAAALALALVASWVHLEDVELSLTGHMTRAVAFFVLGGLVGSETGKRRRLAADREQLLARVQETARTDELTGVANRRAWNEELRRQIERTRRSGIGFTVALLDLDHFKDFNDRHGHGRGDALLRDAAGRWRERLRAVDVLARHGGEEFAVLLPDCPADGAVNVVDRLREGTPMGQTVSGGIARWDGRETAEALLERADRALYEAKRSGRDRCVVAGPW